MATFQDLQKAGAFVSKGTVKKTVVWKRGDREDVFEIHIKNLPAGDAEKLFKGDKDQSMSAKVVASAVCVDEKGTPLLTYEQAYQLEPSLMGVLVDAVNEVYAPKN